jgi:di/tricarboxylate transporter
MTGEMIITGASLMGVLLLLLFSRLATELVLAGALSFLIILDVISIEKALLGFANPGLLCVAILYVVSAGLIQTRASTHWGLALLGEKPSSLMALLRVLPSVATASAFMNNTPLVSMLVPALERWCERFRVSPSKVMMPLSFAAILGGSCTLIGTSTNLLIDGMIRQQTELTPLGFLELGWVALPVAIVGLLFMITFGRALLPERDSDLGSDSPNRSFTLEMVVTKDSPVIGKSIEEAGLRHLPGAFLGELQRGETLFPAVSPEEMLKAEDVLVFVGEVASLVPLARAKGLVNLSEKLMEEKSARPIRKLVEVVISPSSSLIGSTIREGRFRSRFGAVVLAASRGGGRIPGRLGDLVVSPGDMYLMETRPAFVEHHSRGGDFLMVHEKQSSFSPPSAKAPWALGVLALMVLVSATGILDIFKASLVAAGLMLMMGCVSSASARKSIDLSVIVGIGSALGLSEAVASSGLAGVLTSHCLGLFGESTSMISLGIYLLTLVLTLLLSNNAAAVLVFPFAISVASEMGLDPRPLLVIVALAASASFATPIGYQTNLMVMGPGGYRFMDFLRLGLPLTLLHMVGTMILVPLIYG